MADRDPEYVLPTSEVRAYGAKVLDQINEARQSKFIDTLLAAGDRSREAVNIAMIDDTARWRATQ